MGENAPVTPPDQLHVVFSTWKSDGSLNIRRWSTFLEFEGSTAYIAEFIVKAITEERDALARQAEALQRENAELREGLKPFADAAQLYDPPEGDDGDVAWAHDFTIGSLRRARTLLKGAGDD